MSKKEELRKAVQRQSGLLSRMSNNVAHIGDKRVTFFSVSKQGEYKRQGWMTRKDFTSLRRDSGFTIQRKLRGQRLKEGYVKPRLNWENRIEVKCKVSRDGKVFKRKVRINAYTKTQRDYVRQMLRENKVPVNDWRTNQKTINTRMDRNVEEVDITSKNVRGT